MASTAILYIDNQPEPEGECGRCGSTAVTLSDQPAGYVAGERIILTRIECDDCGLVEVF